MNELLGDLDRWEEQGEEIALATLVRVKGSAPRLPGARLAMTRAGGMAGSISGGCVEGDVIERAVDVLETGRAVVAQYGISDEQGFEVGLSCGGQVDVLIEPFAATAAWRTTREQVEAKQAAVLAIGLSPERLIARQLAIVADRTVGSLDSGLDERLAEQARSLFRDGASRTVALPWRGGQAEVFLDVFVPPQRLYIAGATHVAMMLCRMAAGLGYNVTVVDARSVFATPERFPDADEVIRAWPDETLSSRALDAFSNVVVLTHDPKFDLPVLELALCSDAGYIGAMGSRATHARRLERLRERGFDDKDFARIHAPIGLDIGGRAPEELALAILAELVAVRHGRREERS